MKFKEANLREIRFYGLVTDQLLQLDQMNQSVLSTPTSAMTEEMIRLNTIIGSERLL